MKTKTLSVTLFLLIVIAIKQVFPQQVTIIETISLLASGPEVYKMPKISPDGKICKMQISVE